MITNSVFVHVVE